MRFSPHTPWRFLLAAVVLVPLAVGVIPLAGTRVTLNVFVQAKLIALYLTVALTLGALAMTALRDNVVFAGRALLPMGVFLLAAGISTATAIDRRLAFFGDFEQGVGFVVFALCALVALLTTQIVRDSSRLRELTTVVIATSSAVALIGLLQQVFYLDLLGIYSGKGPEWVVQRGYGTIGNADTYSAFLVVPIVLALNRLRTAEDRRDRAIMGGAFLLMLATFVIAQTRAPIAGLAAGIAAYAVGELRAARRPEAAAKTKAKVKRPKSAPRTSPRIVAAIAGAAVVASVLAANVSGTALDFGRRFTPSAIASLGGRLPLWESALDIAKTYPLFGVGPDSFRLGWYPVRQVSHLASGTGLVITDPHSLPMLLAATMGFVGLAAATYLLAAAFVAGARTLSAAGRGRGSDYGAWFYAALALSIALLASLLTSALLFMLAVAIGVLVAPALDRRELPRGAAIAARTVSLVVAAALLAMGLLTAAAQFTAVGARTDDAQLAAQRAARAAAVTPWDTEIRNLKHETMVQAALELVFTGDPEAADAVERAERTFAYASRAEPHEYLHVYREALLLIGSGQRLPEEYTRRGISAGLRGLELYPNSLELRTGVAAGYMQLREPAQAELLLQDLWAADPGYAAAGTTYVESLLAQGRIEQAREALTVLRERFPDDPSVAELEQAASGD